MNENEGRWAAMVEQSQFGQDADVWAVGPIQPADSREHAKAVAVELAKTYRPLYPRRLRRRSVFRHGEDTLFVLLEGQNSKFPLLEGQTRRFHLRVTVVQLIADLDAEGRPFEG